MYSSTCGATYTKYKKGRYFKRFIASVTEDKEWTLSAAEDKDEQDLIEDQETEQKEPSSSIVTISANENTFKRRTMFGKNLALGVDTESDAVMSLKSKSRCMD
ncbi:hypothetical protein BGZ58_005623 [Dissophora ornata]|nr:hypothetical protein BGZ58_005623 [Dissophora ornata]